MNKNQAQQEILRRLGIYMKQFNLNLTGRLLNSRIKLLEYHSGELSKQELIKMITQDKDGNLLSEPENYEEYLFDGGKAFEFDSSIARWKNKCKRYQQAFNQATEIVNCYDGE